MSTWAAGLFGALGGAGTAIGNVMMQQTQFNQTKELMDKQQQNALEQLTQASNLNTASQQSIDANKITRTAMAANGSSPLSMLR